MRVHHLQDPRDHQKSVSKNLKPRGQKVSQVKVRRGLYRQEAKVNPRRRAELFQLRRPSQSSKESRAVPAQASQGVKRRAEDEGDEERVRDIPDVEGDLSALILDHCEIFLASIEDSEEPVCEEKVALPPELQDEAATWWYYDDISGKVLDTQGVQQARRDEIKIIETMKVWEKIPRSQMPQE